jgi:hypothetical protein
MGDTISLISLPWILNSVSDTLSLNDLGPPPPYTTVVVYRVWVSSIPTEVEFGLCLISVTLRWFSCTYFFNSLIVRSNFWISCKFSVLLFFSWISSRLNSCTSSESYLSCSLSGFTYYCTKVSIINFRSKGSTNYPNWSLRSSRSFELFFNSWEMYFFIFLS